MAYLQHPDTQSTATNTTLAVNGPMQCPTWERILNSDPPVLMLLVTGIDIYVVITLLKQGDSPIGLAIMAAVTLFCIYMFLFVLDNHLRLFHAQEAITIQGDALVIDCTGSFLRRHKSIPLTSIRRIEHYDGSRGSRLTVPDTLRVRYGRHGRYRFALNMSHADSSRLLNEIKKYLHN